MVWWPNPLILLAYRNLFPITIFLATHPNGATVVGSSVKEVVFRAVYATINAQLQVVAMQMREPKFLSVEEATLADELHHYHSVLDRAWDYWEKKSKMESPS